MAEASVDASDFRALFGKTSQVDAELKKSLRKRIRIVAKEAADAAKAEVLKGSEQSAGSHAYTKKVKGQRITQHRGLRQAIAAGIGQSVMTGANSSGIRINAKPSAVADGRLVRAYDKSTGWRHPVFGTNTWVVQKGRPYFGSVIRGYQPQVEEAVRAAMQDALDSLK